MGNLWAGIIIDVQGKLGYLSTDTRAPACFALTGYDSSGIAVVELLMSPGIRVRGGGEIMIKLGIISR